MNKIGNIMVSQDVLKVEDDGSKIENRFIIIFS